MATERRFCDLHTHSVCSDGTWEPSAIVREAERIGLSAVALTDHNTVAGLGAFSAAAEGSPVTAVPGVEVSTDYGEVELHVVGLFLPRSAMSELDSMLSRLRARKEASNREMIERLRAGGFDIDFEEARASSQGLFNRANVASILMKKGYVGSVAEAFSHILAKDGPYYVPTRRLPVMEVISTLREMGARPVIAHPLLNLSPEELDGFLPEAVRHGLVGMETVYSTYDGATVALSRRIATEYGLLESGGSDFHGERKPDIQIGTGRGTLGVPTEFFEKLRDF